MTISKTRLDELKALNNLFVDELIGEIERLEAVNGKYKIALEFYANILNWTHLKGTQADENPWGRPVIKFDDLYSVEPCDEWGSYGGKRAREALRESEE